MKKATAGVVVRCLAAALTLWGAAAASPAGQTNVVLSHISSLESPWNKASLLLADYVNERIGDRYKVEVHGGGVLAQRNWKIMFDMTREGSSHIGIEGAATVGSLAPEIGAINLPFLFDDADHLSRFLEAGCPVWNKWFSENILERELVILAATPRPFRQLSNNKRIVKTPADIAGLKFRVPMTPLFSDIFKAMGAVPVPLASGDIYSAIQFGRVVGEDNSITVQYDFKTYEVAKYFTVWNYIADLSVLFMNKRLWDGMEEADREVFRAAAAVWAEANVRFDRELTEVAVREMEKAGVEFHTMTAEEKEAFKELLRPVYDDFAARVGEGDMRAFLEYVDRTRE